MASNPTDLKFKVAFNLYSKDGTREVEVREFSNGETFIFERERSDGSDLVDRHSGKMVGPFSSPEEAEKFITATPWFQGHSYG
jgi:hypothetical protein